MSILQRPLTHWFVGITFATGCVYGPLDGSEVATTTTPITVTGYAGIPDDELTLEALDPADNGWDALATTTSGATDINPGGQQLFLYTFDPTVVPGNYWNGACAELRVTEMGHALATFGATGYADPDWVPDPELQFNPHTDSGHDCISDELLANGLDFYEAGEACQTGDTFEICTPPPPPR